MEPHEKKLFLPGARDNQADATIACSAAPTAGISCTAMFKTPGGLRKHLKTPHQEIEIAAMRNPPGGKNEITKKFDCGIGDCTKSYEKQTAMVHHQDSVTHDNTL